MSAFHQLKHGLADARRAAIVDAAIAAMGDRSSGPPPLRVLAQAVGASAASVHGLVGGVEGLGSLLAARALHDLGDDGRAERYLVVASGPLGPWLLGAGTHLLDTAWWASFKQRTGPHANQELTQLVGQAWLAHTGLDVGSNTAARPAPAHLPRLNLRIAALGTELRHPAFTLASSTAQLLSANPASRPYVRPLITASTLMGGPRHWAIDLGGRPKEHAQRAQAVWRHLLAVVPPEAQVGAWWQHPKRRTGLYSSLASLERAVVLPVAQPERARVIDPRGLLFDHTVGVLASDRVEVLAVALSGVLARWCHHTLPNQPWQPRAFETLPLPPAPGLADPLEAVLAAQADSETHRTALAELRRTVWTAYGVAEGEDVLPGVLRMSSRAPSS